MAPRRKGPRVQLKARVPPAVRTAIKELALLHDCDDGAEITEALLAHITAHDPGTCMNPWCVARRTRAKR